MIKRIFKGNRASGKTATLLKQASALAMDGITPIFLFFRKDYQEVLKSTAAMLKIDTTGFIFKTWREFQDFSVGRNLENCRLFIDETEAFINNLFPKVEGIYLVESIDYPTTVLDRKDWDKDYREQTIDTFRY